MDKKLIDWCAKGNTVRFFLGNYNLKEWWGDDWNDVPYEHNAGEVYREFVSGLIDVHFDFDDLVTEPCHNDSNSNYTKDHMRGRNIPMISVLRDCVLDRSERDYLWDVSFEKVVAHPKSFGFFMGDPLDLGFFKERSIHYRIPVLQSS